MAAGQYTRCCTGRLGRPAFSSFMQCWQKLLSSQVQAQLHPLPAVCQSPQFVCSCRRFHVPQALTPAMRPYRKSSPMNDCPAA